MAAMKSIVPSLGLLSALVWAGLPIDVRIDDPIRRSLDKADAKVELAIDWIQPGLATTSDRRQSVRATPLADQGDGVGPWVPGVWPPSRRAYEFALAPSTVAPARAAGKTDQRDPKNANIVIDAIVAYTRKAAGHYEDIKRELIEPAIEEANASFRRSNLGHIALRLVHAYATDYAEEGTHFDHVWRFADKGDGYLEEVHALRDAFRADVAILVVDDPHGCGLATRIGADADEAFAVVHHECAVANYTLAHEIGHLIGASHELAYVNGTKWRDIMGYKESCGGCVRVPVWSNPTVLVNGEPAGTPTLDNARVIAERAARVAAFR
jgi:hypothetical protein